jgi:ABC-2 type transport system ATP-binding protein
MRVISVDGLCKVFRTKQKEPGLKGSLASVLRPTYKEVEAVSQISFHVETGELLAFIGPNGAGKSTTIKMLTGILHPTSGTAEVLGMVPWKERYQLSFQIGSVFGQKSQLWYHLPPLDTFNLLGRIYELDPKEFRKRRDMLVDVFELKDFIDTPVRKLSLGQRMRCEIAASLLHKPSLLFLDEPTIGLDVIARQKIRDLIKWMNQEESTTIFLTSHDTGDIESICKRVIIINHGTIILDDSVSTLKRDYIKEKVIDLKLGSAIRDFTCPGATIQKRSEYGVKLVVDTYQTDIGTLLEYLVTHYPVVDVNISNPPLEQVIAQIYTQQTA